MLDKSEVQKQLDKFKAYVISESRKNLTKLKRIVVRSYIIL